MAKKQRIRFIGASVDITIDANIRLYTDYIDFLESEISRELECERLVRITERNWDIQNPKGFSSIKKTLSEEERTRAQETVDARRFERESSVVSIIGYDKESYARAKGKILDRTRNFDSTCPSLNMPKKLWERQSDGSRIYFLDCFPE